MCKLKHWVINDPVKSNSFCKSVKYFVYRNDEPKEDGGEETPQEPSMWEEQFSSHSDSKPRGPESIGVDIDFPLTQNLYGIPEHADDFRLKDTR